jgi:hypothetical protein
MTVTHRVRLKVIPWDDRPFTEAVERAIRTVEEEHLDLDAPVAAEMAQASLRVAGWPRALVTYHRTVDEVLGHIAHWEVYREPPA